MDNITIGTRIAQRRKEVGMIQRELSKAVGVSTSTISLWESDATEPRGKNLHALAHTLQCSPTWLLFGDSEAAPQAPEPAESIIPLTDDEQELLNLYRALPVSEQESQINELRARVENFEKLFSELLQARKRINKK